jgi:hypothetical protein
VASFTLRESIAAPIEIVFDVLADHQGQADRTLLRSSTLERVGDPPPNGVGAIRRLSLVGPPIREEVTVFEPPRRFVYKMLSGVPVQSHVGTVELAPHGTGTLLVWRIDSVPKFPVPAAVWSALVRPAINVLLRGVKQKAEARAE